LPDGKIALSGSRENSSLWRPLAHFRYIAVPRRKRFQFRTTVKYRGRPIPTEDDMRKFLTELRGKTVMTNDGQILGLIENFVVDTQNGAIAHVLVQPNDDIEQRLFQTDASGRLVLPFKSMRAVKDVVVMEIGK
jgi:sporulation protein YlmC with PRC-barrel domain